MMPLKRIAALVAIAAAFITGPAGADVINVAQVLPFEGSVETSTRATAEAAELYLRRLNAAGGVNGHIINVVTVNGSSNLETAARRTAEVIRQHRPVALLNYYGSARTEILINNGILDATRTPVIGANVSSTKVRQNPGNQWVFYLRAGLRDEAERMVRQSMSLGGKRVAVLYQGDAFGEDGLSQSMAVLRRLGIKPLVMLPLETRMMDAPMLNKIAETVLKADIDVVLMFSDSVNVGGFLRAYRERGGTALVATDSTSSADEIVRASSADLARGVCIAEVMPAIEKRNTSLTRAFVADMTAGGRADLASSMTALEGYVSARLFVEALRRVSGPVTGETIRTALQTRGPYDLGGFELRYGPTRYEGSQFVDIGIIGRNGRVLN
ncbi:amino acid-binding protein [Ralstonia solanacearum]|nr:ABC transporter substrate-binding protein [Ralstonia solanacearum]KFX78538.1 amino acid-binding protein [Ralstonia solanacearum]OCQ67800.1 amino acid-binding protein [Ralstonia solanacearum]